MNLAQLRAELEADQAWRRDEIRFFQNQTARLNTEEQQNPFRRVLILLLYAHFEGFSRFALTLYVNTINSIGITCGEANSAIAAASLANLFRELRDPQHKSEEFRRDLPDDTRLHRFARDREFIERIVDFTIRPVNIPDYVVDTESNLNPVVLRKNLYRLGLPYDLFKDFDGQVHQLLNYRNQIAHGERQSGIERQTYESLRDATFTIMDEITREIIRALQEKRYQR
jgi:hypothetical protein